MSIQLPRRNQINSGYQTVIQTDLDRTRDEFEEEQELTKKKKEEMSKTNIYKSRIIDTEINSSLTFQIFLYYNFFYAIICFNLQFVSVIYKVFFRNSKF